MDLDRIYGSQIENQWISIPRIPDAEFFVAQTNNMEFKRKFQKLCQPFRKKLNQDRDVDPEKIENATLNAMIGTVILDWRNLTIKKKEYKFSHENAFSLFKNFPAFQEDFIHAVDALSEQLYLDQVEEEENIKK